MRFRPCIDLHQGKVKQIVGSSLCDSAPESVITNFEADVSAAHFARLYRADDLPGGHVIMLGPGNESAAREALAAYPGGLQLGGGITAANASSWLEHGASKVIVTSYVFHDAQVCWQRLEQLAQTIDASRLVLDLSCRRRDGQFLVVTDRWQKYSDVAITAANLDRLAQFCSEFLVHAVDVEGKQAGIDAELVGVLAAWNALPITYAGGIGCLADIRQIEELSAGRLDYTVGSALDIFGGSGLRYRELVELDSAQR